MAKLCLAKGVPIQAVEELVRRSYVNAATQALSLAFLKQTLGGEANALADWQPKFADLLARFVPAK